MAFAAARGASRTVAIQGVDILAQPTEVAAALAAAVQDIQDVSVVSIGDAVWSPMVPSLLAARLGWPCILAVDAVRPEGDGLVVMRRFGAGTQDVRVAGPVVLGVAARREEAEKPGMRAILQARKKPVENVEANIQNASTFAVAGVHEPAEQASKLFDGADPAAAAAQLVSALQSEGVL
jgi:electron transfer flavoprotein beta subunit